MTGSAREATVTAGILLLGIVAGLVCFFMLAAIGIISFPVCAA